MMKNFSKFAHIIWLPLIICAITISTPVLFQEREVTSSSELEVVAQLDLPPGNIAVSSEGRIFLSLHQAYQPELKVMELLSDGSVTPFRDSPDIDATHTMLESHQNQCGF